MRSLQLSSRTVNNATRWRSSYSSCTMKLIQDNKKPKIKLTQELPGCIRDVIKYSACKNSSAPKAHIINCASQFGLLPDHERWARFDIFMTSLLACVSKLEGENTLNTKEIMKLIECCRYFPVSPSSPALDAYLSPLVSRYTGFTHTQKFLTPQDMTALSGGMNIMTNETMLLEPLLKGVIPVLSEWGGKLTGREAQICLYSLRGLNSNFPLTVDYLNILRKHLEYADWKMWDMFSMVAGLSGLQRMDDSVFSVKKLFEFLCTKYMQYEKPFHTFAIGNALLGLLRKNCTEGVAKSFTARLIHEIHEVANKYDTTLVNLEFLQHRAALVFPLLNIDDNLRAKADLALLAIRSNIKKFRKMTNKQGYLTTGSSASQLEDDVIDNFKKRIQADGRILLSTNEFVYGFEADILFRIPDISSGAYKTKSLQKLNMITINVEIDGPHHNQSMNQFLDALRDKYLSDRGIIVVRLNYEGGVSRTDSISDIFDIASQKQPSLSHIFRHWAPNIEDFGDSFKKGKKCRSNNVRFIRGPEDLKN